MSKKDVRLLQDKLFVMDLDHTLFRSDLTVSSLTKTILNERIEDGWFVTFATARGYRVARRLLDGIDFRLPVLTLNGALMIHAGNHEVLHMNRLPPDPIRWILDRSRRLQMNGFLISYEEEGECLFYQGLQSTAERHFFEQWQAMGMKAEELDRERIPSSVTNVFFIDSVSHVQHLKDIVEAADLDQVRPLLFDDTYNPGFCNLQFSHPLVDKGRMLAELARYLNISLQDTIVFGDHLNDLSMFETAGYAVAVRNAHPDVIAAADEVIASNDEDGIAYYFDRSLRKERLPYA